MVCQHEGTPIVQVDFCFARFEPEDPLIPMLCAIDSVYRRSMFVWRDRDDVYAVKGSDGVL